jgi:NTE family protein
MKERALVLGGGGPAGIAWHVGLASGLAAEGVDVRRADAIIGTSAGAFVGAQLATNFDPQALAEMHLAFSREAAKKPAPPPVSGVEHLIELMRRTPRGAHTSVDARIELGKLAMQASTVSEAEFVGSFAGMFGANGGAWSERFSCCSVNARDGVFKRWTHADGVPLERAVAASCSVPAIYPPVTLGDSLWVDGALRSWTNADCAAGYRRVLIFAVVMQHTRELLLPVLDTERTAIEAAGGKVALIIPDARTLEAAGDRAMDGRRSADITEAAIAQGRSEAARLRELWE